MFIDICGSYKGHDTILDMKHCEKCHFEKHLHRLKVRKMGVVGVILMGLHILFHVIECLVLPSILVAFGGHLTEEPVAADSAEMTELDGLNTTGIDISKVVWHEEARAKLLNFTDN